MVLFEENIAKNTRLSLALTADGSIHAWHIVPPYIHKTAANWWMVSLALTHHCWICTVKLDTTKRATRLRRTTLGPMAFIYSK